MVSILLCMELDREIQLALVDEIRRRIPPGAQKRVAIAIATALGTQDEAPRLTYLLQKREDAVRQLLGPERIDKVVAAICAELTCGEPRALLEAARQVARARPRVAPDRHPAWSELGDATPWVGEVPGMTSGLDTLKNALGASQAPEVVWLVGEAGSGKTAWLWRASREGLGDLVSERPAEPPAGRVFLVDEPGDLRTWQEWANRRRARLVIATRRAPEKQREASKEPRIELARWSGREVGAFLGGLRRVQAGVVGALDSADLDAIVDRIQRLGQTWTPLELGHALRFLVDEPVLVSSRTSERELRIRHALDQMVTRGAVSPGLGSTWRSHGRQAAARAAGLAMRRAAGSAITEPVDELTLQAELAPLAGTSIGGRDGEPLAAVLVRAKKASEKKALAKLEEWAAQPSTADLVAVLVATGLWRREGETLTAVDHQLSVSLAAEALDEAWRWQRLRDTLADPGWSHVRRSWASCFGQIEARIDQLLATGPAVHVGAIELATALAAHAPESPRPDQLERVVYSALQVVMSVGAARAQFGHQRDSLAADLRVVSRRHRRALPQLATTWDAGELARRGTTTVRAVLRLLEELVGEGESWLGGTWHSSSEPLWCIYARHLPWQARDLLEAAESRAVLLRLGRRWEQVIIDHAEDGHAWARAIATGDVEDAAETYSLVSERAMLDALCRWRGPRDRRRHENAVGLVLHLQRVDAQASDRRLLDKAVQAVADLARSHAELELPSIHHLGKHEGVWLGGLVRARATRLLREWFAAERLELNDSIDAAKDYDRSDLSTWHLVQDGQRHLDPPGCERLVALAEALHSLGEPGVLLALLGERGRRLGTLADEVSWKLAVGAARVLLRLREAAPLREALS